jgi:hypothetical protein
LSLEVSLYRVGEGLLQYGVDKACGWMSRDIFSMQLSSADPRIERIRLMLASRSSVFSLRKEHGKVIASRYEMLLVVLNALLKPGDKGWIKAGPLEVEL